MPAYLKNHRLCFLENGKPVIYAKEKRSQSQLLRSIIHEYWTQQYAGDWPDFDPFYKAEMSRIIGHYKSKLI